MIEGIQRVDRRVGDWEEEYNLLSKNHWRTGKIKKLFSVKKQEKWQGQFRNP